MCQTRYTQERVLQAAPAQCADARADLVHGGYLRHARSLDARHHAGVRDPDARPILQLGLMVGKIGFSYEPIQAFPTRQGCTPESYELVATFISV